MKPALLVALILMSCVFAPCTLAQQHPVASDASTASARVRDLEKLVKSQTERIHKLEQDLQARDEEVHMLVKIISKQSDKDSASAESDGGNTGSSDCDVNPAARILKVRKTQLDTTSPAKR